MNTTKICEVNFVSCHLNNQQELKKKHIKNDLKNEKLMRLTDHFSSHFCVIKDCVLAYIA